MKQKIAKINKAQILITLLIFMSVGIMITSAAVVLIITNSLGMTKMQEGNLAYSITESGVENALLRLLRNPNYNGETITIGEGTATISVESSGGNQKTITSSGRLGNFLRKIQVIIDYTNNTLTILSWKEIS